LNNNCLWSSRKSKMKRKKLRLMKKVFKQKSNDMY